MADNDWVIESVIGFLRCPIWRVPILTFIESNCLVFDSDDENNLSYTDIHKKYQMMVETLLDSFISDIGIDSKVFLEACVTHTDKHAQSTTALFEQVHAAEDFSVFKRMMLRKNVELELQALEMIQKRNGVIPDILKPGEETKINYTVSAHAERDEEMLLQEVLRISKEEHEAHKKANSKEINEDLEKAIANSKEEEVRLKTEQRKEEDLLNQSVKKLVSGTSDLSLKEVDKPSTSAGSSSKAGTKPSSVTSAPPISQTPASSSSVSGAEAAANWLSSAKSESVASSQVSARAAALASSSPAELQKREQYLKQQRDKLLALKKREREKNLSTFTEEEAKSRPKSARAARQATSGLDGSSGGMAAKSKEEQEKTLAMRKALAERLKQEVINKS
ncbi:cilia- and flagella-associated protein 36-like isoform X2 [Apostichopus japonicus]|uniref:cilia- and flagella-associated protein 36-like isoform X2 n=1 Tax=Stichopus japonicus TaxID=307972 RepID=UPI003AB51082